ncbi:MAG: hypothetical protein ACXV76_13750 [Halobacteriota archaeon]
MPFKDKDKARKYQRDYQRRRRSEGRVGLTDLSKTLQLETLDDLRLVFERITLEILDAEDLDLGVKGRILGQPLAVGIKLVEGTDLEHRIAALEKRTEQRAELSKYP